MAKSGSRVDRRKFLSGAAAAALATPVIPAAAQPPADGARVPPPLSPAQAAQTSGGRDRSARRRRQLVDRREPRLRLHGRRAEVVAVRVCHRESRVELPRAARVIHQLRRQHGTGVAHVHARASRRQHRERLFRGRGQANGRRHVRSVGLATRGDGYLRRVLGTDARRISCARTSPAARTGGRCSTGGRTR